MEPSNTELNRAIPAPLQHEQGTTSANQNPYSSEKNITPSSPTQSFSPHSPLKDPPFHNNNGHNNDDSTRLNDEMNRSPSAYRIPSSVFERSKSSTPADWSVASNESLFSIHTGNMSFTNDYYIWRSGELGPPLEASTSDQIFSYSAHESGGGGGLEVRSNELGIAEATMLEVIKESEGQNLNVDKTSLAEVRHARRSEGSNTSNKSFAFSVMGGETGSSKMMPSSVRSNHEQAQSQETVQPPEPQPDPTTPKETGNRGPSSWPSCFSCCLSRK